MSHTQWALPTYVEVSLGLPQAKSSFQEPIPDSLPRGHLMVSCVVENDEQSLIPMVRPYLMSLNSQSPNCLSIDGLFSILCLQFVSQSEFQEPLSYVLVHKKV